MKARSYSLMLLMASGLALNPAAHAADASDASPYDKNPACMDRTDSPNGNCVVQDEGSPRHRYAPPGQPGARPGAATGSSATGSTGTGATTTAPSPRDGGRSRGASNSGK